MSSDSEEKHLLRAKSVGSPIDRKRDGLRILVTRVRGRGLPSSRYDVWMPNLGPSERLLARARSGKISWRDFSREYRKELFLDGEIDRRCKNIKNHGQKFSLRLIKRLAKKGNLTLMCHCEESQTQCHRFLLKRIIETAV